MLRRAVPMMAAATMAASVFAATPARADSPHWHTTSSLDESSFDGASIGVGSPAQTLLSNVGGRGSIRAIGGPREQDSGAITVAPGAATAAFYANYGVTDAAVFVGPSFGQTLTVVSANAVTATAPPNGTVQGISMNGTELLAISVVGNALVATSYDVSQPNRVSQTGSPVTVYSASAPPAASYVSLAGDGDADLIVDAGSDGVQEIRRGGAGSWGTPTAVTASDGDPVDRGSLHVAVADATMVATFTSTGPHGADLYAATATADQGLGPVQTLVNRPVPAGGSATTLTPMAAIGSDGTLAVAAQTVDCAAGAADAQARTLAWVASPDQSLQPVGVPSMPWSPAHTSAITALAAGGGAILVATRTEDITGGSHDAASCSDAPVNGEVDATFSDLAWLSGVGTELFGSSGGVLGADGQPITPQVGVVLASVFSSTSASVFGNLDRPSRPELSGYDAAPDGGPVALPPPQPAPVSTPGMPGVGRGYGAALTARSVVGAAAVVRGGRQVVSVSNPLGEAAEVRISEVPTGIHGARPVASLTVRLRAHGKARVMLRLTGAGMRKLAARRPLPVSLRIVTTAGGRRSSLVVKKLVLHAV